MSRLAFRRRSAFTMLELLVVTAIVGVLVVTLIPAISSARNAATVTSCSSNLRQQGIGWNAYTIDYQWIPGMGYNEGTYGLRPPGAPYFYGGVLLYGADGGPPPSPFVGFANMGYTVPYVIPGATFAMMNTPSNVMNNLDGRVYYCPGTVVSFSQHSYGQRASWYSFWQSTMGVPLSQPADAGTTVPSTYFYRNGMYDVDPTLPDNDPKWSIADISAGGNWTRDTITKPNDLRVANKPMNTCFWRGVDTITGTITPPIEDNRPHKGVSNFLVTDGSVFLWKPKHTAGQLWDWFDAGAYTAASYNKDAWVSQLPWYWVLAARRQ